MARFTCQRVLITEAPFGELDAGRGWIEQGIWPAFWITHPSAPAAPCRMEYRLNVSVAGSGATTMRLHTAGDEHYEFRVDGALAGWGSERGTVAHWYFDTYDLTLEPGDHCLTAKVTAAGKCALRSQMSVVPAFLLAAETAGFSTGEAAWEVRHLEGLDFEKPFDHDFFSVGWNSIHDAARRVAAGEGWQPARALHPGSTAGRRNRHADIHLLAPAVLPVSGRAAFIGGVVRHVSPITTGLVRDTNHRPDEAGSWAAWWDDDEPLILPPGQQRRVLFDLQDYVCAWPQLEVSGGCGARVRIFWAESLSEAEGSAHKGNRAALEGKTFSGLGDTFLPDGSSAHTFDGPFIRAGRYVEMIVTAGEEPLVLNAIRLLRAEYPLEISARFATKLACVEPLLERCRRTVRASCHDSLIDGPYYEQMGWIGDTAQVSLTLYSMSADTRLVRKALDVFDRSRLPCGMIRARWPARDSLVLPPYAMCWINVLHDFSWWRNEPGFVQDRLPGMRAILDGLLGRVDETDGLLRIPSGWNFTDWVHGWDGGIPPRDPDGAGAVLQWQL
ncbi:MAG: alpha-L-rhamnosidase, partial [Verrucomicrobiota bacterium]